VALVNICGLCRIVQCFRRAEHSSSSHPGHPTVSPLSQARTTIRDGAGHITARRNVHTTHTNKLQRESQVLLHHVWRHFLCSVLSHPTTRNGHSECFETIRNIKYVHFTNAFVESPYTTANKKMRCKLCKKTETVFDNTWSQRYFEGSRHFCLYAQNNILFTSVLYFVSNFHTIVTRNFI
jgi:hypothetical protein